MKPPAVEVRGLHFRYPDGTPALRGVTFSVFQGEGRAALDSKTMARDIPCQAACPAGTNVPEYIRHLV